MQVLKKPNTQEGQWNGAVCNTYIKKKKSILLTVKLPQQT